MVALIVETILCTACLLSRLLTINSPFVAYCSLYTPHIYLKCFKTLGWPGLRVGQPGLYLGQQGLTGLACHDFGLGWFDGSTSLQLGEPFLTVF